MCCTSTLSGLGWFSLPLAPPETKQLRDDEDADREASGGSRSPEQPLAPRGLCRRLAPAPTSPPGHPDKIKRSRRQEQQQARRRARHDLVTPVSPSNGFRGGHRAVGAGFGDDAPEKQVLAAEDGRQRWGGGCGTAPLGSGDVHEDVHGDAGIVSLRNDAVKHKTWSIQRILLLVWREGKEDRRVTNAMRK